MTGNVIYRGPIADEPQTINIPVSIAMKPGTPVVYDAANDQLDPAVVANADDQLYILSNRRFYNQDVTEAYASGDTGVAYEARPGEVYQGRMAAGTYAVGDALTINASSQFAAAGLDVPIVAYCWQAGTFAAGGLADVKVANRLRSAPA